MKTKMTDIIELFMSTAIVLLLITGCGRAINNDKNAMDTGMTYLALGDSYTIGEGVAVAERWPVQLTEVLNEEGFHFASPEIIAKTGWTTDELMHGIEKADPADTYDLVSLLIGVNNQFRGRDTANFRTELTQLMELALGYAGNDKNRVVVLSIPDWGVTPFATGRDREKIASEIDAFNHVLNNVTKQYNVLFINVTEISRLAGSDSSLLAPDGLHPSGRMYGMWVEKALAPVMERIKNK